MQQTRALLLPEFSQCGCVASIRRKKKLVKQRSMLRVCWEEEFPIKWIRRKLFVAKDKLSPSKNVGQQPYSATTLDSYNLVIGSCTSTTNVGMALDVSSAGIRNPSVFGMKSIY